MEFNITLNVIDRVYNDIKEYCRINSLDLSEYLSELIESQHMINKYGDLNEIIPKAIEESKVEVKKRGQQKKKDGEATETTAFENTEYETVIGETDKYQKELLEKLNDVKEEEKTTVKTTAKRKRTLKTL